ncbi:nitroreductase [Sulfitobacter mediterraneus]|uniref:nitroreductase n=1 Tax=Sulfitobacter mediterraneus TaxID=83219 RepID=UPI0019319D52|nr:nitroreductase [Sulfitobacter mediterraneus]MBM1634016.1 nitroreductase [Sulfitobacter mediterraneus]MBM1641468.1 nitroreductase [Sulfitobacter mediterraneus]MBM1645881.1 nitroreductase [Sulfitobacter mediterraneus]MBM1649588.1 nitroreductase [Sulfitobacter mediterraneus]MBM1653950.1 nitroreductase [Sulfitobacter mediterraneus]
MTQIDTLTDILKARHSCRAFRPDPVADSTITQIVKTARHVPSWCNAQPWQVSVTKGAGTEAFRQLMLETASAGGVPQPDLPWPKGYSGAYAERRRTCGFQLYDAVGIDKSDRKSRQEQMLRNYALFDAPHVAIVHSPAELGPYGAMDSGGFVTAFTLAATALGVATVPQAAIAAYAPQVREHFGLGDDRLVLCAISFGYADTDHPANKFRTERAEPSDIIQWKE